MIPGYSDVSRLPRLGVIRLGEKRESAGGKAYPAALDHLNLKDAPAVAQVYGDKPTELDIMFPVEDVDVFFEQALKAYRQSGLFCKSNDGQNATRVRLGVSDGSNPKVPKGQVFDQQGEEWLKHTGEAVDVGEMFEMPCPYHECGFFQRSFCKPNARIMFLLPQVPGFGCWQITTTSWNSIVNLNSYIKAIKSAAGRISMIPLKLRLIPQQAQVEGKSKTIHVLTVVYEGTLQSLIATGKSAALPVPVAALPAPDSSETPGDLFPHGGEALDQALGAVPARAAAPKDGPTPAEAARAQIAVGAGKLAQPSTDTTAKTAAPSNGGKKRPWG